jgi:Domain of unknown function (DUF222)/HNH endonuclease
MIRTLSDEAAPTPGAAVIATTVAMSAEERTERLEVLFRTKAAAEGEIAVHLGEVERSESYRLEGATSTESWVAARFGVSGPGARALSQLGEKASDLPHLVGALCAGEVSLDKVRAVAEVATPENDGELCAQAKEHSVRELVDIARTEVARRRVTSSASGRPEQLRRYLRCNDSLRTLSAQLPPEDYAEAKACLETRAKAIPTDGEGETPTPWDQRCAEGFMDLVRSAAPGAGGAKPFFVVAHVALSALVKDADSGEGEHEATELAGELERVGLIDTETVQKIACDATVAVAVDDDVGHTMYEGRAQRFPTAAQRREVRRRDRHCRFPGCRNVAFADVHHVVPWEPGGKTDLDNLACLCRHHHGVVHRKGWSMTGNANEELSIVGPSGRVMTSRPSPLWTRITDGRRAGGSG